MEYKHISPYKVCFIFGIFNFIVVTIAYIIISFIPCDAGCCLVEYNDKHYFGNIILIFSLYGLFMFILLILKAILTLLNYIIIYEYSVCHSFLIFNLSELREFSLLEKNEENIAYIIFRYIALYFIINILILIFLEIIEINICGLSFNTKKNIEARAILDSKYSIDDLLPWSNIDVGVNERFLKLCASSTIKQSTPSSSKVITSSLYSELASTLSF